METLTQSVHMLQALRDPRRPDHQLALRTLETSVTEPLFILHMLHIFAQGQSYEASGLSIDIRQLSGLIIKNYVFPHLTTFADDVQYLLKRELISCLQDPLPDIRKTGAILIGKISESFPPQVWINMLVPIFDNLSVHNLATRPHVVDGALMAVQQLCEDSASKLAAAEGFSVTNEGEQSRLRLDVRKASFSSHWPF